MEIELEALSLPRTELRFAGGGSSDTRTRRFANAKKRYESGLCGVSWCDSCSPVILSGSTCWFWVLALLRCGILFLFPPLNRYPKRRAKLLPQTRSNSRKLKDNRAEFNLSLSLSLARSLLCTPSVDPISCTFYLSVARSLFSHCPIVLLLALLVVDRTFTRVRADHQTPEQCRKTKQI